ncbi:MAG: preprotein translocase subunit SecE [Candidatus Omnitrophica bacterium]|nr:preprotein translocase subunit SecE [Candidatus Omnitrophota bacterium]
MDVQKIITIIVAAGILVTVFIYRERIRVFLTEVSVELKKVSWPTRKELIDSTWIVLLSSIALAVFIGITDFALSKFLSLIINR